MTQPIPSRRVLVADDDEDDRYLLDKAFRENGDLVSLSFVADGKELLDRLEKRGENQLPDLVLLDLNMPRLDGRHALKSIKASLPLRQIPVVILTTSADYRDVTACYDSGANSFFSKPASYAELLSLIKLMKDYWLGSALLPNQP